MPADAVFGLHRHRKVVTEEQRFPSETVSQSTSSLMPFSVVLFGQSSPTHAMTHASLNASVTLKKDVNSAKRVRLRSSNELVRAFHHPVLDFSIGRASRSDRYSTTIEISPVHGHRRCGFRVRTSRGLCRCVRS